jgi:CDP-4-dehydro-6-deoxyglucose reductase, E1
MSNYPLATSSWGDEEIKAIQKVVKDDSYTMGKKVRACENELSSFLNRKYSVMVNSGSAANLLAIASLFYTKNPMLRKGDEVIVPAVSWSTTYFPLQQFGLKLKFVDIDLSTLNYNLDDLKTAITNKTKLLMVVNLLGNPNEFNVIEEIIDDKDIVMVEDNCESLGAEYQGRQAGTFGLLGTFSSFFSHHISTMEGGFVTTDDEELYHILISLRAHGWTRDLPKINMVSNKSDDSFEESFRFILPGFNVRPLEMSGAIGIEQIKKLKKFIEQRRANARLFIELFTDHPNFLIQKDSCASSWFGFALTIKPKSNLDRKVVLKKLLDNSIEFRPIVGGNFVKNEVMKYIDYSIHKELINADYIDNNGFFVGNSHINLSNEINNLHKVLGVK